MSDNIKHIPCVELLAPARDYEVGIAAIDSGADAIYIGAPKYSARQAAGNSIDDIARMCQYAHKFNVKVLVALNTILTDDELRGAEDMVWQLYNAGVDALIVQDMGLLTLNLPPMRLHASTQCDNRTVDKVLFLQDAGFSRVVLARELSAQQIKDIRCKTNIELEAFVHGALCVSYSGQCYMSQYVMGRSANKGQCAQMCRQRYDLLDEHGNILLSDKHLLSVQDMDRSGHIKELVEAGVTTLKIEGRLKDADYVKNITAYYRNLIDTLGYRRPSWGTTTVNFEPSPAKTFHRGATPYFIDGIRRKMANFDTPKSTGEYIGTISGINTATGTLTINTSVQLHNGDGFICGPRGFRASEAENIKSNIGSIKLSTADDVIAYLNIGDVIYRNYDIDFQRRIGSPRSVERTLPIDILMTYDGNNISLSVIQPDSGLHFDVKTAVSSETAKNQERMRDNMLSALRKLGGTLFHANSIELRINPLPFMPISVINDLRRRAIDGITRSIEQYASEQRSFHEPPRIKPVNHTSGIVPDYHANVSNSPAKQWYAEHGVVITEPALEVIMPSEPELMRCKYCLRHELDWCLKNRSTQQLGQLYLRTSGKLFALEFDCKKCEMIVKQSDFSKKNKKRLE